MKRTAFPVQQYTIEHCTMNSNTKFHVGKLGTQMGRAGDIQGE